MTRSEISKSCKAHLKAMQTGEWTPVTVNTTLGEVKVGVKQGCVYEALSDYVLSKYVSIGSQLISTLLREGQPVHESFRRQYARGFQRLMEKW